MTSGFEDWLPPVDRRVEDDRKHTVLLVLRSRRALRSGLASVVLLAAGVAGIRAGFDATGRAGFWAVAGTVAAVCGLAGTIAGSAGAVSWYRDHRSVRTTGWRRGTVRAALHDVGNHRSILSILVEYDDGSCIRLRSHYPGVKVPGLCRSHPRVLIGGAGPRMVVLFRARRREPLLLQVTAETYRWLPE